METHRHKKSPSRDRRKRVDPYPRYRPPSSGTTTPLVAIADREAQGLLETCPGSLPEASVLLTVPNSTGRSLIRDGDDAMRAQSVANVPNAILLRGCDVIYLDVKGFLLCIESTNVVAGEGMSRRHADKGYQGRP